MIEQEQLNAFEELRGTQGTHYDLAKQVEAIGLVVEMDPENNERSEIVLAGCWHPDGANIVVGEILGDAEAQVI